jgi:hypothetical protein
MRKGRKNAETLAKELDFETKEEYYNYIVESLINGNRTQVKSLFLSMKDYYREEFLNDYLNDDNSYNTSTRKICISAMFEK